MATRVLMCGLAVVMALTTGNAALAQRPRGAGSKITGNAYNFYSGSLHTRHAGDHARVLRAYSENPGSLPPEAVQHHTAQIQQNVASAKAALAQVKPTVKDADSQKLVKALETHYAACEAHCKTLMAEGTDGKAMAACCQDLVKSLEAAQLDHDKLMKKIGVEPLLPSTETKK